jgi:hypothetical protein
VKVNEGVVGGVGFWGVFFGELEVAEELGCFRTSRLSASDYDAFAFGRFHAGSFGWMDGWMDGWMERKGICILYNSTVELGRVALQLCNENDDWYSAVIKC